MHTYFQHLNGYSHLTRVHSLQNNSIILIYIRIFKLEMYSSFLISQMDDHINLHLIMSTWHYCEQLREVQLLYLCTWNQ